MSSIRASRSTSSPCSSSFSSARRSRERSAVRLVGGGVITLLPLVAVAGPGPASAAVAADGVVTRFAGLVTVQAAPGQVNDVQVFLDDGRLVVTDSAPLVAGDGCDVVGSSTVDCGAGVTTVIVSLGDRDDEFRQLAPVITNVQGGEGNDVFHAGQIAADSQVTFAGDPGFDTVSYASADRFVTVSMGVGTADDGRPGDRDTVTTTVERLVGSLFPDRITGSPGPDDITGGAGADVLAGGDGDDVFFEGNRTSGADDISGGAGSDSVSYQDRTANLVIDLDGTADDGEANERDNVRADVEDVTAGDGDDRVTGSKAINRIDGGGGEDELAGGSGDDLLTGGAGNDAIKGGGGDDGVLARDGELDRISCGGGRDDAVADAIDITKKCERS